MVGRLLAGILGALPLLTGCGHTQSADPFYGRLLTPTRVEPTTDEERSLLARAHELPTGEWVSIDGLDVEADRPYYAASGRSCRHLRVRQSGREATRLACADGESWVFVPDSLGTSAGHP